MAIPLKFLFEWSSPVSRQVNETNTRVEDGKTITETVPVTRTINVPFGFKLPSRLEREDMKVEQAVWCSRYIDKGIKPAALLNKLYANDGGILDNVDQILLAEYQARFLAAETELKRLEVNEPGNKEALTAARLEFVQSRNAILRFHTDNAVFFNNTAESMARQKTIEWALMNLTYYRPTKDDGTNDDWTPFFPGATTEDRLEAFDKMVEGGNEMWAASRTYLEFLATFTVDGGTAESGQIAEFLKTLDEERKVEEVK